MSCYNTDVYLVVVVYVMHKHGCLPCCLGKVMLQHGCLPCCGICHATTLVFTLMLAYIKLLTSTHLLRYWKMYTTSDGDILVDLIIVVFLSDTDMYCVGAEMSWYMCYNSTVSILPQYWYRFCYVTRIIYPESEVAHFKQQHRHVSSYCTGRCPTAALKYITL